MTTKNDKCYKVKETEKKMWKLVKRDWKTNFKCLTSSVDTFITKPTFWPRDTSVNSRFNACDNYYFLTFIRKILKLTLPIYREYDNLLFHSTSRSLNENHFQSCLHMHCWNWALPWNRIEMDPPRIICKRKNSNWQVLEKFDIRYCSILSSKGCSCYQLPDNSISGAELRISDC